MLLGAALYSYSQLHEFSGKTGFYYEEKVFTREQIQNFWSDASDEARREIQEMALFRSSQGRTFANSNLNRTVSGELIEAAGNMELVVPGRLIRGSFASDSDKKGCVISRKTAEALYSSYQVIGNTLYLDQKEYRIRGIVDIDRPVCIIQGAEGMAYPYLRVQAPRLPLSAVKQMLAGVLPAEEAQVSEGWLYQGLGSLLLWLPAWVLLGKAAGYGRKRIKQMEKAEDGWKRIVREVLKMANPVLVFAGICGILMGSLRFSEDYIPSAWSDFAFWTELFTEKSSDFLSLVKSQWQYCDERMLVSLAGVAAASILLGGLLLQKRPGMS